ncbi:MAG: hypothetical protein KKC43_08185 [Alphaproteobacteria bacterium]|nr:hypothetical protein [Alphaproteobacteria bacterium]
MNLSPLLILGMHRSGTSCLAGCLEAGGLTLGDVNTSAPFNRKGNREHERIRSIHDRLLAFHGYSWDKPPAGQLAWRSEDLDALSLETEALRGEAFWGLKDPRTVFCMAGWQSLFAPRMVVTFRHPEAVAASLVNRSLAWKQPMTRETAIDLWSAYNTQILALVRDAAVPCIRYDCRPDQYQSSVADIASGLGLDAGAAVSFYSAELIHNDTADMQVPEQCASVWSQLEALSLAGAHPTLT